MKRAFRTYGRFVAAIAFLAILAIISGAYILINQRIKNPFADTYTVYADMTSSSGLAPGLGQAVNVAGVRVGQISGSKIIDGRARIGMEINRKKLPHVYENAKAELVANTPLKDLVMELGPGRPPAKVMKSGGIITIANTSPPIDSDELTDALDADTRDYFNLFVSGFAQGTQGRGHDLHKLLTALGPTAEQTQEVTDALAARRHALRRLTTNLAVLTKAAAAKDKEIGQVTSAANVTLQAISSQEGNLRSSLDRLPNTLKTIRSSLNDAADFSDQLGPTLNALMPAVRRLPGALRATAPLVRQAQPILRDQLRPLVREIQPLGRDASVVTQRLTAQTPDLSRAFQALGYTVNELAYNPAGDDEGFLFWTAWFAHNAASVGSVQDAHGPVTRGLALFSCDSLGGGGALGALLPTLLANLPVCPN